MVDLKDNNQNDYIKKIEDLEENVGNKMLLTDMYGVINDSKYSGRIPQIYEQIQKNIIYFIKSYNQNDKYDLEKMNKLKKYYISNNQNIDLTDELIDKCIIEIKNYEETSINKKLLKETFRLAYPSGTCSSKFEILKKDLSNIFSHYSRLNKNDLKNRFDEERLLSNKKSIKYYIYSSSLIKEEELKKSLKKPKVNVKKTNDLTMGM